MFRTEKDTLGEKEIPSDALYGIHAIRAKENKMNIFEANALLQMLDVEKLDTIISPANILKLGYSIGDLLGK